jgi:hypothetical protein
MGKTFDSIASMSVAAGQQDDSANILAEVGVNADTAADMLDDEIVAMCFF